MRQRVVNVGVLTLLLAMVCVGQQSRTGNEPGSIKGKVRVDSSTTAEGVGVSVRQGAREVAHTDTDQNGRFEVAGLAPGRYDLVFRKRGLSTAELKNVDVSAGKTRSLGDRVYLTIDEGTLAFLRGSVFDASGHSVEGAQVELARILPDGTTKKIDGRVTNESGSFAFRLTADAARYRVTVKFSGRPPVSKDVEIDGAAIYRVALSLAAPVP